VWGLRAIVIIAFAGGVVAACGGDGVHVEIRVPGDLPVTRVDLFLTRHDPCTIPETGVECQFIMPPSDGMSRKVLGGELYNVDDPTPFHSTVEDGSAWFYLAPNAGKVKTAIAVGRDDNGESVGVVILTQVMDTSAGLQYFSTELLASAGPPGTDPSVELWPRNLDAPYACVAAQVDGRAVAIVPANDPDCDFVDPQVECAPTIHLAAEPASNELFEQTCADVGQVLGEMSVARRWPCDEKPISTACVLGSATFCVPDAVCNCSTLDDACIDTLKDVDPAVQPDTTRIVCTIPISDNGDGTHDTCIGQQVIPVNLGGASCDPIAEIGPLDAPLFQFQPAVEIDTPGGTVPILPFVAATGGCTFSLRSPDAVLSNATAFPLTVHALVKLSLEPSGVNRRLVVIPLDIDLRAGMSANAEARCELRTPPKGSGSASPMVVTLARSHSRVRRRAVIG
jgi:hypothetical protein